MLILSRSDVESVLTLDDCITAVEEVFRKFGEGRITAPQSLGVQLPAGAVHVKTAVTDIFAAKINANLPENPVRHGLPMIQGIILLMSSTRGVPLAIIDSTLITTLRTAAASAVAATFLAREDSEVMTIAGCGNQGRAHLEAIARVRPIRQVFAWDLSPETSRRFAEEMSPLTTARIESTPSLDDAVGESDIIVTCTPARNAILHERHARSGLFIAAVGADNPDKQELDPRLLDRMRVVPDIATQAAELGELHHAITEGLMTRESIHGELGQIVSGAIAGRLAADESFIFDSTGTALQDVATAEIVLRRAEEQGIGTVVNIAG